MRGLNGRRVAIYDGEVLDPLDENISHFVIDSSGRLPSVVSAVYLGSDFLQISLPPGYFLWDSLQARKEWSFEKIEGPEVFWKSTLEDMERMFRESRGLSCKVRVAS